MANYNISFVAQDHMDVYCENICTGKCYNAVTSNTDNSEVKIMQEGPCYKVFSMNHNFSSDWKQIKMVSRGQCQIAGLVKYKDVQRVVMLALDTGAQCNVISQARLYEIFERKYIGDLKSTNVNLKTADDSKLNCRGQIDLMIKIGRNEAILNFIVIDSGNVLLLGVPAIEDLSMVIDIPNNA